ncbi:hypothetical protein LF1_56010 [Rubripirellula obstinata]|uniref:Uncharacterized protein n=1 Tax=Rubripirellula obstinata TaxID=406547 RepID=A0A5B1CAK8_9BACT|nr:hypothetical protein [Rubripirellula obstinata]KAA1257201.1 hypothetical protein LF1_56010 [Rubripirellula obstinata]
MLALRELFASIFFAWLDLPRRYFRCQRKRLGAVRDSVLAVARSDGRYAAIQEYRRLTDFPLDRCRIETYRLLRSNGLWQAERPHVRFPYSVDWEQVASTAMLWATWIAIGLIAFPCGVALAAMLDALVDAPSADQSGG